MSDDNDNQNDPLGPEELDAELGILGAIMLFPEVLDDVAEILVASDFLEPRNRLVFAAMQRLDARGAPLDMVTLADELGEKDLAEVGGMARLSALDASVASANNAKDYCEIVKDGSDRRRIQVVAKRVETQAKDERIPLAATLSEAHAAIISIEDRARVDGETKIGPLLQGLWRTMQYRMEHPGPTGMLSGLTTLDTLTGGFQKGDLVLLGARPSMGKSAASFGFAVNIATGANDAWHGPMPVYIASLEMSKESVTQRILCAEARIDSQRAQQGHFEGADWAKMARAGEKLAKAPLHVEYMGGRPVSAIRTGARKVRKKEGPLGAIVVDYIQLCAKERAEHGLSETDAIGKISTALKNLAGEFECPVIALSQLNRELEKRTDKRPIMSDLRSSGSLEQDADGILFIYRPTVYEKTADPRVAEILVSKQRNGPTGKAITQFEKQFTKFSDLPEGDVQDYLKSEKGGE